MVRLQKEIKLKAEYIIIGSGRLAKHLDYYFSLMNIPHLSWHRKMSAERLKNFLKITNTVLLAISDSAIEPFINSNKKILGGKTIIHFSGALATKKAFGCHPLMSFSHSLYDHEFYKTILFCVDEDSPGFEALFPKLPNPHITIPKKQKPFYHAL